MDRSALQNTIDSASRRRRALVACLLLAALWAVAAPALAQRSFERRFPVAAADPLIVRGDIALTGNTSLTCQGGCAAQNGNGRNNSFTMVAVDIDGDGSTTNSSSATLDLPAGSTVLFAGLYWAGKNPSSGNRGNVRFSTPASGYTTVAADRTDSIGNDYQSFADVTQAVRNAGSGVYTVANVALRTGAVDLWAGWTLVVAYQNPGSNLRNLSVFDGFQLADGSPAYIEIPVSGFYTPPSGPVNSNVGLVTYDGDRGQPDGSASLRFGPDAGALSAISNALNPVNDVFNSSVTFEGANITGRNPGYTNTLGIDIDVFQPNTPLPNGSESAVLRVYGTSDDVNYPGVITIATDVFEPEVVTNFTKAATDANGAPFRPGDEVTYTVSVANTGNDDAQIVVITDPLPAGVTYVPGSIVVTSGPNAGAKSDAAGDDQAEFNGSQIVFRAGIGADANQGGTLEPSPTPTPNSATEFRFRVRINQDIADGTQISNVASVGYRSATTGETGTGNTPPASFSVVTEADLQITKTNTPANGPTDGASDTVAAGSSVDYSIVVTNAGPSAANNAAVRDPAPTGLACATAVCDATNGAACPAATGPALVTALQSPAGAVIPTLPVNGVVTITLTCDVVP